MQKDIPLVHIYSQEQWHDESYIVGNRLGLQAIRDTLNEAIDKGKSEALLYTSDGEGYYVRIISDDSGWQGEFWDNLEMPYTQGIAAEPRDNDVSPWSVWRERSER